MLEDTDSPFQTDTATVLTINFKGENPLTSISSDDFYNRVNLAAVGQEGRWEIIAFQNATLNADNLVEVTTILRGRRGTETHVGDHEQGDLFILINADVHDERLPLVNLGDAGDYAAVGLGGSLKLTKHATTVYEGNSSKPYAPWNIRLAHAGSDCVLSWTRRSRLPLLDTWDDTALAETTEAYEIDICNASSGAVIRTLTSTTTSVTYTAANQATDGFTAPADSLRVKIYQVSSTVGRGFTKDTLANVE
jgi:hypothetical protein